MKHSFIAAFAALILLMVAGCENKKGGQQEDAKDSLEVSVQDTAIYGTVGEGTTMHVL